MRPGCQMCEWSQSEGSVVSAACRHWSTARRSDLDMESCGSAHPMLGDDAADADVAEAFFSR